MRAQIEQVSKNVNACLDAGGATVEDIAFIVSYVIQPAEFEKYADLRERYFRAFAEARGLPHPTLASPDFLM